MTILDPNDFIYAAEISKAPRRPGSKPIDRDNDMKVYDNTKRERPALPDERLPGAGMRGRQRAAPGRAAQRRVDAAHPERANMAHVVVWRDRDGNEQARVFDNRKKARDYGISLNNNGVGQNVRAIPEDHPDFQGYANRGKAVTTPPKPGKGEAAPGGKPFLVHRTNDEFDWDDVVQFDNEKDARDFMAREGVRNVGRETAYYRLDLVEPDDADYESKRARARTPKEAEMMTGPGTKWLEDRAGVDRNEIRQAQGKKIDEKRKDKAVAREQEAVRAGRVRREPKVGDQHGAERMLRPGEDKEILDRNQAELDRKVAQIQRKRAKDAEMAGVRAFKAGKDMDDLPDYDGNKDYEAAHRKGWAKADAAEKKLNEQKAARPNRGRPEDLGGREYKGEVEDRAMNDAAVKRHRDAVEQQRMQSKIDQAAAEIVGGGLKMNVGGEGLFRHGSTGKPYFVHLQNEKDGLDHVMQFPDEEGAIKWVMAHERLQVRAKPDERINARIVGGADTDYAEMEKRVKAIKPGELGKKPLPRTTGGGIDADELAKPGGPLADSAVDRRAAEKAKAAKRNMEVEDWRQFGAHAYDNGDKYNDIPEAVADDPDLLAAWRDGWQERRGAAEKAEREKIAQIEAKDQRRAEQDAAQPGVRRAIIDERGFREVDEDGKTIPPKPATPQKAKLQIRQNKGYGGGYNVVGRDAKGKPVKVRAKNREIAENIKAALANGRELQADDYLDEFERAEKQFAEKNKAREAKEAADKVERGGKIKIVSGGQYELEHPIYGPMKVQALPIGEDDRRMGRIIQMNKVGAAYKPGDVIQMNQAHLRMPGEAGLKADAPGIMEGMNAADVKREPGDWAPNGPILQGDVVDWKGKRWMARGNFDERVPEPAAGPNWEQVPNTAELNRAAQQANADDAMARVARQKTPGVAAAPAAPEPVSPKLLMEAMELQRQIKTGRAHDLGSSAKNQAGRRWLRARVAAAEGNKDGYLLGMEDYFKAEENLDEDEIEAVMQAVEDDILGEKFDGMMEAAFANVEKWGNADGKADKYFPGKMREERNNRRGPKQPRVGQANTVAIRKHFDGGGGIMDAPDGDILDVVKGMPDRFNVLRNGDGGVNASYFVIDKQRDTGMRVKTPDGETTNEVFFFKAGGGHHEDAMAEVMVADIIKQADLFKHHVQVRFGRAPRGAHEGDYVFMPHYGQNPSVAVWDKANRIGGAANGGAWNPYGGGGAVGKMMEKSEDNGSLLRLGLLDFFINNTEDRHWKNLFITVDEKGNVDVAPVDHGIALWNGKDKQGNFDKFIRSGWQGKDEWQRGYKNILHGRMIVKDDRMRVQQELRKTIDGMRKVKIEELRQQWAAMGLTGEQRRLMEEWATKFTERIKYAEANFDNIVNTIMGMVNK